MFLNSWYRGFCWTNTKCRRSWKLSGEYCVLLPSSFSSTFSLERSCHSHGTQSSSVPTLWGKLLFSFYSMLCLLVLVHYFALKLCALYAQFITPVICCPDWHQPGNITWKFIAQRTHHPFFFFFPLWSVTGGTVFEKVSLSLPRCSLALQLSHIANCSYQNFKMLQGICWIHRVKWRKKKVIWCSFQVEKINASVYTLVESDLYSNRYTSSLWIREIL